MRTPPTQQAALRSRSGRLSPRPDGALEGAGEITLPLSNTRLQARVDAQGVHDLFIWGGAVIGSLRFYPAVPGSADVLISPNRLSFNWLEHSLSVAAIPTMPAILVRYRGPGWAFGMAPVSQPPTGFTAPPTMTALTDGWRLESEWAALESRASAGLWRVRRWVLPAGETLLVVGVGESLAEAAAACQGVLADPQRAWRLCEAYRERLVGVLEVADPVLKSLFVHGLHAALASRKEYQDGRFAGFAAGYNYAVPARTYFRDSYWTLQVLLPLWPELALEQLRVLGAAIHPDGEAPSGVIATSAAGQRAWQVRRAADPQLAGDHPREGEWWADHFDSPLYYCLLACEVAAWLSDPGLLAARDVRERLIAILDRYARMADLQGLPVKPEHDRDWADNVFRSGYVTYNLGLYYGALVRVAGLLERTEMALAAVYRRRAAVVARAATLQLWLAERGYFAECRTLTGHLEDHLMIDTLTAVRYGLASERQARAMLRAMRERLETRHNRQQPYGDWGVMSVYPPYSRQLRRRGKSAFAYRYHNGSDWPYWDGVYAEALLLRQARGWRYPLTRWWTYGLEQGWPAPVEYYAPPWGVGSRLNAWSSMPAAAMVLGGFAVTPNGSHQRPPWGLSTLSGVQINGRPSRLVVTTDAVEVEYDG